MRDRRRLNRGGSAAVDRRRRSAGVGQAWSGVGVGDVNGGRLLRAPDGRRMAAWIALG